MTESSQPRRAPDGEMRTFLPGIGLAAAVAVAAAGLEFAARRLGFSLPAIVIALALGIVLSGFARASRFESGLIFCFKKLLRWAIALLGLRIAMQDIAALGVPVAAATMAVVAVTLLSGVLFSRLAGVSAPFGAISGASCGVCGASAALAASTAVPDYADRSRDLVLVVVAANLTATVQMLAYPSLCHALGLADNACGIALGLGIHDMAQVAGAGYAMGDAVGNVAVVVKLTRVFLLLPVVLLIGLGFRAAGASGGHATAPIPWFGIGFLALAGLNSVLPTTALAEVYATVRAPLVMTSQVLLLVAIAALGLTTSVRALMQSGWRRGAVFAGATMVNLLLAFTAAALLG